MEALVLSICVVALSVVVIGLASTNYRLNKEIKEERKEFTKERADLVNRVICKSTADYKDLTKINNLSKDEPEKEKRVSPLDEQLRDLGALEGGPSPYPRM